MRIYHDWEFLEDGTTIQPIAVAMCTDSGDELYCVFEEVGHEPLKEGIRNHKWLMEHVVPHLPLKGPVEYAQNKYGRPSFVLDDSTNLVMPRRMIRNAVRDFVLKPRLDDDDAPAELWGWYSAYDHVALAQLFGRMVRLPEGFPMLTRDLKQRWDAFKRPESDLPGMGAKNHDPLAEVRLMRDWAHHMDELERAGERYGLL